MTDSHYASQFLESRSIVDMWVVAVFLRVVPMVKVVVEFLVVVCMGLVVGVIELVVVRGFYAYKIV